MQVDALAREALVRLDPHVHVEVAVGPAPRARPRPGPVSRRVEPVSTPGGDVDGVGALLDRCGPRRRRSAHGSLITRPCPLQRGQTELVTIWPRKLWRTRCTWPTPAHSRQVIGSVPGLAPVAPHGSHGDRGAHVDGVPRAEHRLLEGEVGHHLEVGAARRPDRTPPPAAAEGAVPAEEGVEDVVDARRPRTRRVAGRRPSGPKRS